MALLHYERELYVNVTSYLRLVYALVWQGEKFNDVGVWKRALGSPGRSRAVVVSGTCMFKI